MHCKYKKEVPAFLQKPLILQMIWLSPADFESPIDLLHQKESDQLMRECEVREREPKPSSTPHLIRQPEGTADEKGNVALPRECKPVQLCRKLLRGTRGTADIQDDEIRILRHAGAKALSFTAQDLCLLCCG